MSFVRWPEDEERSRTEAGGLRRSYISIFKCDRAKRLIRITSLDLLDEKTLMKLSGTHLEPLKHPLGNLVLQIICHPALPPRLPGLFIHPHRSPVPLFPFSRPIENFERGWRGPQGWLFRCQGGVSVRCGWDICSRSDRA